MPSPSSSATPCGRFYHFPSTPSFIPFGLVKYPFSWPLFYLLYISPCAKIVRYCQVYFLAYLPSSPIFSSLSCPSPSSSSPPSRLLYHHLSLSSPSHLLEIYIPDIALDLSLANRHPPGRNPNSPYFRERSGSYLHHLLLSSKFHPCPLRPR